MAASRFQHHGHHALAGNESVEAGRGSLLKQAGEQADCRFVPLVNSLGERVSGKHNGHIGLPMAQQEAACSSALSAAKLLLLTVTIGSAQIVKKSHMTGWSVAERLGKVMGSVPAQPFAAAL
jgi:hypothetical protein